MPTPQQQNNIQNLNSIQSQLAAIQQGPQAVAAGMAQGPVQPGVPGSVPAKPQQPLNRKQKQAQIGQNVQNILNAPPPKAKIQGLTQLVAQQPSQQSQRTSQQQAKIIARELARLTRSARQQTGSFLNNLATPGDIWLPISVFMVLVFVLVPVTGQDGNKHTRLGWLWLALIGAAHIEGEQLTSIQPASVSYNNPFVPLTPNIPGSEARVGGVPQGSGSIPGTPYHPESVTSYE